MYSINDQQIDYILNDIRRRGVEMEDLQYNLLDHICCIIEQNLESDGNFEDFYNKTIPKFFKHELWEIEEETILLLTYKNYYTMKKAMIYGGVFSLSLIALGTVFKIFHWPGSAPLLILGFLILCFVFFPSALYLNYSAQRKSLGTNLTAFTGGIVLMLGVLFKVMHWPFSGILLIWGFGILLGISVPVLLISKLRENISAKEKIIYITGALGIISFGFAALFKIMHWPGAAPLLILGSFLLIGLFVPLYTNMQIKANKMNAGQFVFVITLSMNVVVLISLMAMNVSRHVLERFSGDEKDNMHIVNYFEKKKQRLIAEISNDSTSSPQMEAKKSLIENATKAKEFIHALQLELISSIENVDNETAEKLLFTPHFIIRQDHYDEVNHILFALEVPTKATRLKKEIENYQAVALKLAGSNEKLTHNLNELLKIYQKTTDNLNIDWETHNFHDIPLIITLIRLSDIEKNICQTELEVLTLKN